MKLSIIAKPISSPGRADKFPPPIMRFLRSNVGSRSRGRSRSSPMFIRKLKSATGTAETTQEPTSPKVTCMGQVRVRRSGSKQSGRSTKIPTKRRRRRHWIRDAFLCHRVSYNRASRARHVSLTHFWRKWASCCHLGCGQRPTQRRQESEVEKASEESKSTNWERRRNEAEDDFLKPSEEDEERLATAKLYAIAAVAAAATDAADASTSPCSPPKNALLLTRCRSAPYRSSSLACRFWGSPLKDDNDESNAVLHLPVNEDAAEPAVASDDADESSEQPKKNSNVSSRSSDPESRVHPENEEIERYLNETECFVDKPLKLDEQKLMEGGVVVRLERCKSEPAGTAGKKLGFY